MRKFIFISIIIFISSICNAQIDSIVDKIKFNAFIEAYYSIDDTKYNPHKLPGYVNYSNLNSINLNLALLDFKYEDKKIRTAMGIMAGTYANNNFSSTDQVYQNIYELNFGYKLARNQNLWLDVGIFSSHIGVETPIGSDNWMLTRSFQAEASPYYEAGLKLGYTSKNDKLFISLLILNGWQTIQPNYRNPLSFGHQIQYKFKKLLLNSSSYLGYNAFNYNTMKPMKRYFHNFYAIGDINNKFSYLIGLDLGAQSTFLSNNSYYTWYTSQLILKYNMSQKNKIALRYENIVDKYRQVFVSNFNDLVASSISLNYEHQFTNYFLIRTEAKSIIAKENVFRKENSISNENYSLTASLILKY